MKDNLLNPIYIRCKEDDSKNKIDATIGMLKDDNHQLIEYKIINHILKKNLNKKTKAYDDVIGEPKFNKCLLNWLKIEGSNCVSGFSFGGTGALNFVFKTYCKNKRLLLPSLRWKTYDLIANENGIIIEEYDHDNLIDLIDKILLQGYLNNEINVLINDPCHNPTGYCFSENEWNKISSFLQKTPLKINLIIDLAYIDYHFETMKYIKDLIYNLNNGINVFLIYSLSKSFHLYGYRGGACLLISNDINEREEFIEKLTIYNRTTFSSPNHFLTHSFIDIFIHSNKIKKLINTHRKLLLDRANFFISHAKRYKLELSSYISGFFIFIYCRNADLISSLLADRHIYVMPYINGIRISISSISKKDCIVLIKQVKDIIDYINR